MRPLQSRDKRRHIFTHEDPFDLFARHNADYAGRTVRDQKKKRKKRNERGRDEDTDSLQSPLSKKKKRKRRVGAKFENRKSDRCRKPGDGRFNFLIRRAPYNGAGISRPCSWLFGNSRGASAGMRHKRGAQAAGCYLSHPRARPREKARANLFGRVCDDVAGTGYRLYEHGGESYGFSIVSRGCFDLGPRRRPQLN